jgi:hypothetical protein
MDSIDRTCPNGVGYRIWVDYSARSQSGDELLELTEERDRQRVSDRLGVLDTTDCVIDRTGRRYGRRRRPRCVSLTLGASDQ